jgi:type IV secretory pathway VirB10-like protein
MEQEGIAMTDTPDNMPDSLPSGLGKRSGVRRVNNVPLYIIGSGITLFLIFMAWVAIDRANKPQGTGKEAQEKHGDTSQLAKSITGTQMDGMIPATGMVLPSLTVPIAIPDDLEKPPMPPSQPLKPTVSSTVESEHIKQEKMQRFENAVTGKTTVPFPMPKPHTDASDNDRREQMLERIDSAKQQIAAVQQDDTNANFKARLAQLQGDGGIGAADALSSQRNNIKQFNAKDKSDRWQLNSEVEAPKTPYTLRAGFIIPATLISGINSDLPGQIIGQISQNVYDTATGKYLLVAQGSRLVGSYTSDVAYGQSRVLVAW